MSIILSKPAIAGLLLLSTLISGVWLSHSGKPYNTGVFTIHKLISLATVIIIGVNVYNLYRALDLQAFVGLALLAASGLFFLALLVTGALLSLNISLQGAALRIHQAAPLLALVFSSITLYLLAGGNS